MMVPQQLRSGCYVNTKSVVAQLTVCECTYVHRTPEVQLLGFIINRFTLFPITFMMKLGEMVHAPFAHIVFV